MMIPDRAANVTFFDFVGGVQLLHREEVRTAVPVVLIGVCVSGAVGNLLVLLIFIRDFRGHRGSEVKTVLSALASTDLLILLLCAPVRAVTYYSQAWTLGGFMCNTADWIQHSCVVAKTLTLAASTRAKHTLGPSSSPAWILFAFIWTVSVVVPVPQLLYASLEPHGSEHICVAQVPICASDFMSLYYKIYPVATFVVPVLVTVAYHTKSLHAAVNHAPGPSRQSKVSLVLLCLSGCLGLALLPDWGTFTWTRLGHSRPPVGITIFAQVLLYASSAVFPVILMTMYDDVRQGLITVWYAATCRGPARVPRNAGPKAEENGAELTSNTVHSQDQTIPDVEHFWTGRRNTQVEDEQDPVPWEKEEKML